MLNFANRPLVYVAGPYRSPEPVENTNGVIAFADRLHRTGHVTCVVPHLSMFWHLVRPHPVEYWLEYDLALLARCDALLRIPGESEGSDNEVLFAKGRGIPVFQCETELLDWATKQ